MDKQKKTSSFLGQVKEELYQLILTDHATDEQDAREITDNLWKFVRKQTAQSYWNGVEHGASGKVKPKSTARPSRRREGR